MTYEQLKEQLESLNKTQLQQDVSVLLMNSDEVCPVCDFVGDWPEEVLDVQGQPINDYAADCAAVGVHQVEDVLDDNHPYLTILD